MGARPDLLDAFRQLVLGAQSDSERAVTIGAAYRRGSALRGQPKGHVWDCSPGQCLHKEVFRSKTDCMSWYWKMRLCGYKLVGQFIHTCCDIPNKYSVQLIKRASAARTTDTPWTERLAVCSKQICPKYLCLTDGPLSEWIWSACSGVFNITLTYLFPTTHIIL
jgi:hypothetical protein